jgi:putative hydrolases of HD superfamily
VPYKRILYTTTMTKPDQNTLEHDVNFLFEMGNIRLINRTWRRFQSPHFANLAEHHFRVFWVAMMIAAHEEGADTGKVAKLAILHDIAESRTGDVDLISRQYVDRHEEMAIRDMLEGTGLEDEYFALWEEYEKRESLEARIVKDADNLDVDFELAEQRMQGNASVGERKQVTRDFVAKEKLFTETAKKLYAQLSQADPHAWWHQSKRNRFNGGDWQK